MQAWSYDIFKENFHQLSGINLTDYKERQMKRRIDSLISRYGYKGYGDFYHAVLRDASLYKRFVEYLTINVSEFYRNPEQWEVLKGEILPYLFESYGDIKIWSSACSTGEEPYSLVMLLNEFMTLEKIRILATDIDEGALEKASRGEYPARSLANLPQGYKDRYMSRQGEAYRISGRVKNCVTFKKMNLLEDVYPARCHLILCRNVMIYFTEEAKERIYHRFHQALVPGGILFVGSTEQIINPKRYGFETVKSFFYRRV